MSCFCLRSVFTRAACLLLGVSLCSAAAPIVFDFEGGLPEKLEIQKATTLTGGGALGGKASLQIDTRQSGDEWTPCARTVGGLLQPGTEYCLTFSSRVVEAIHDGYLLIVIRPLHIYDHHADLGMVRIDSTEKTRQRKLVFRVPETGTDYAVQLHAHTKILALVDDIRIAEGDGLTYYPAAADTGIATAPTLPTGSEPFTVELPRANEGVTLSGAEFGMSPDSPDNTAALQAAIDRSRETKASRLLIPKGTYRFTRDATITFNALTDFTFDGQGATFVFLKKRGDLFHVRSCTRVELTGFKIDWDWAQDPLGSVVRVDAATAKAVDLTFVDYERFPRRDIRLGILEELDPTTMSVGCEDSFDIGFEFHRGQDPKPETEWLADNQLRIRATNPHQAYAFEKHFAAGKLFRIRHYVYDMHGIVMSDNSHLTLRDIDLYSCPGHALVSSGDQHHWQFLNVNIIRPPGTTRPITCTADHHHITQSQGYLLMDGCEFSLGGDDCLNVHDCSGFATAAGEYAVQTRNMRQRWMFHPGDPVELRNGDYSPTGFRGTVKSVRTIDDGKGIHEITFNEKIPAQAGDGFVLFNWRYDSHNVIVRNCYFHDNRARGLLLLGRDITVENNRFFHNQMGGIKIETGYTFNLWSEGYGASNIVIRNNRFDTINPMGAYPREMQPVIYMSVYLRTDPSEEKTAYPILHDILVEDNEFRNNPGVIAYVCSAGNVTIRNNTIINDKPRKNPLPYRGAIGTAYTDGLYVTGNHWVQSAQVARPGVLADDTTTRNINVRENKQGPAAH